MADVDGPPTSPQLSPPEFRNDQTSLLTPSPLHPPASVAEKETSALPSIGETLALSPSVGSNRDGGYPSFSELLGGVISSNRVCFQTFSQDHQTLRGPLRFEGKFEMSHLEALSTVTAEAARDKKWMEPQAPSHKSPVTSSEVCQPSSTPVSQEPSFVPRKDAHMQEADQQNCSNLQLQSKDSDIIMKSPAFDRFNWRKYGQKQVRSSESHRSYYRCSHSDCHAKKKVQHCDHSGCVIEVNYKGEHNHDPPQKIRCPRSRRYVSATEASMGSDVVESPSQKLDGPGFSVPQTRAEHSPLSLPLPEMERIESQDSRNSNDILSIKMEEVVNNLEARNKPPLKMVPRKRKRFGNANIITNFEGEEQCSDFDPRMKESPVKYSDPLFRSPKEPKIVVHAAIDVEISSDGYRWRKYGQKKVKGNSYPRSYYRCASAGCPVRKHVERTLEEAAVIIITYEGKHDHDMPVPKKCHVPPILIEAAAAMNNAHERTESSLDLTSPTGSPVDIEGDLTGEKALEHVGEKAL